MDTQELLKQVIGIPIAVSSLIIDYSGPNHAVTASTGPNLQLKGFTCTILAYNTGILDATNGNHHLGMNLDINGRGYQYHNTDFGDNGVPKHPLMFTALDNGDKDIVIVKKIGEKLLLLTHFLIPTKEDLQSQYEKTVSDLMSASTSSSV